MTVEFIGFIGTRKFSEIHPARGPVLDREYVETAARAHEESGFDRALLAFQSTSPESILVAAHAASVTERLGFMIAHRPGFTAPTLAARQFATLDQLTGGRVAVHVITGGDDGEQRQDGDFLGKEERYERTDEYLDVMRRIWTSEQPFDHAGKFYRFERGFSAIKSLQRPHIPIFFGGASDAAIAVAGRHADIFALWGQTHAQLREIAGRVLAAAAKHGRQIRLSISFRPILAETEEAAWARADAMAARVRELNEKSGFRRTAPPPDAGGRRLMEAASQGVRHDKCLWTGIVAISGGRGNSVALVGTPAQVAESLFDYYELGVTTFLIRGFDPLEDTIEYGRSLIPAFKRLVAERARNLAVAHA
jgi:alkanesulfonate monooxygenase